MNLNQIAHTRLRLRLALSKRNINRGLRVGSRVRIINTRSLSDLVAVGDSATVKGPADEQGATLYEVHVTTRYGVLKQIASAKIIELI